MSKTTNFIGVLDFKMGTLICGTIFVEDPSIDPKTLTLLGTNLIKPLILKIITFYHDSSDPLY